MTFNELIPLLQYATFSDSSSLLELLEEYKRIPELNSKLIQEYTPLEIKRMYIANHKYGNAQIPCKHCGHRK